MQIAICDDDKNCCVQVEKWLDDWGQNQKVDLVVDIFFDINKLDEQIEEGYRPDILFLDIEFPQDNGISMAKHIRKRLNDLELSIVFISGHTKYCMDLFGCQPLNFHHKPLKKEDIIEDIDMYMLRAGHHKKQYKYYDGKVVKGISIGEIIYMEAKEKVIEIATVGGKNIRVKDKLTDIARIYSEFSLCQCHRSFIINLFFVEKYKNGKITMSDGTIIPVGRKYSDNIKAMWSDYEEGNF